MILAKKKKKKKKEMIVLRGGDGGGGGLGEGRFKHTLIVDTTQILNNFEYISRTMNINSQNKRHFTYITQFTIHFFFSPTFLM